MYQFLKICFSPQISLQFFPLAYIIYYTSFFFNFFPKVCFSQVLHFMRVEHQVDISWGLKRTSLYSMMFLNPCWHAHLHLMQTWKTLRMTMTIMRILSSMIFVRKLVNSFIFIVYFKIFLLFIYFFYQMLIMISCFQDSSLCNFFLSFGFVNEPLSIFYSPPLARLYGKSFSI